jgi:hypothetical protein
MYFVLTFEFLCEAIGPDSNQETLRHTKDFSISTFTILFLLYLLFSIS